MGAFKPASRPGSYGQQVAHVDNVSRLRKKQERDRNDQIKHNKQLADNHRAYNQSVDFGVEVEGKSREIALAFDDYYREINQQNELQGIQNAHASAIRNAELEQAQVNKDTDALVSLVGKTLDTGFEVYKQREAAIVKSQTNALESAVITMGPSMTDLAEIRGIEGSLLDDENTTDATLQKYRDAGWTNDQLRAVIGARQSVYDLSVLNQARRAVSESSIHMFNTGVIVSGFDQTADELRNAGNVAGLNQAHTQYIQSIARQYEAATGQKLNVTALAKEIERSRAAVLSQADKVRTTNEAARIQDEQLNHAANLTKSRGADGWAERWNKNPHLIQQDFKNLETLASVTDSKVDSTFISELRKKVNPHTGRTYEQDYSVQLDRINDKIISERSLRYKVEALDQKDMTTAYIKQIQSLDDMTAAGAEKVVQNARDNGVYEENIKKIQIAANAKVNKGKESDYHADQEWAVIRRNNPHLVGFDEEAIWAIAPNAQWAEKKINEMYKIQGRDPYLKDAKDHIERALKDRLGIHGKDKIADKTYVAARRHAIENYKRNRARLGIDGHKEALALFDDALGGKNDAFNPKVIYSVPDASKDSTTKGFVNFQSDATGITEEAVTYSGAHSSINQVTNNSRNVGERLKAIGEIDTSYLTDNEIKQAIASYGNINAPVDTETWNQLEILKSAIGGGNRVKTMDLLTELANARGIEVQKFEQATPGADQIIRDVQEKFGTHAAMQIKNGAPTRGQVYRVGNIGPTSTGAHLDVKLVGGGRFEPNALDNYVIVHDRELGDVPLSQVPITDTYDDHVNRGSHGIDYGIHAGDTISLINGATVLGSVPTEHGDKLSIRLPDGRVFTFLHGTTLQGGNQ